MIDEPKVGEIWRWAWIGNKYTTIRIEQITEGIDGIEVSGTVVDSTHSGYPVGNITGTWHFGDRYLQWKLIEHVIPIYNGSIYDDLIKILES
jgi:hypothetical protein